MNSSNEFVSARRRYRALTREQKSLAAEGTVDEQLNSELAKLESQFPQLKDSASGGPTVSGGGGETGGAASAPANQASPEETSATADDSNTQPVQDTASTTAAHRPQQRVEQPPPLVHRKVVAPPSLLVPPASESRSAQQRQRPKRPEGLGTSLFALKLYNETHQRSVFGPVNFMKIVVIGVLNAALHFFVVDPCSPLGAQLVPSVFCLVSHLYSLYSLYLKRRTRFSLPMLLVYIAFDFIPSMVSVFVAYALTLSSLRVIFSRER